MRLLSSIENLHEEQKGLDDWFINSVYSTKIYQRGEEGVNYHMSVLDVMKNYKANEEELLALYSDFARIVSTRAYQRN